MNFIYGVRTREIKLLKPVLVKFLQLNKQTVELWEYEDIPWWYNERAQVSILAGAVWKCGGFAFEEFTQTKTSTDKKYQGRSDLFFTYKETDFIIEAKVTYLTGNGNLNTKLQYLKEKLNLAARDAKRYQSKYDHNRVAVLFVGVRFSIKIAEKENEFNKLIAYLDKLNYSAIGWAFDKRATSEPLWGNATVFPGLIILLKKI